MRFISVLLLATCLSATITPVGSAKISYAGVSGNGFPQGQGVISYTATSGNLLVVACLVNITNTINLRMIDGVNTWVKDQYITDTTHGQTGYLYHASNVTGGALSLVCQPIAPGGGGESSPGGYTMFVREYSGFGTSILGNGSNPLTAISAVAGTSPTIGLLQTAEANALLVSFVTSDSSSASCLSSAGSGWSIVQSNTDASTFPCGALMEQIVSSTGNWTASATIASADWVIGIMPYVPTSTAPSPLSSTSEVVVTSNNGWSNSSINTSNGAVTNAVTYNGNQYVCYAASSLAFRIAKISIATGSVTTYNPGLPLWSTSDLHNSCSIQFDLNGHLHLTYDMHVSPLIYYRSTNPEDPSAFTGPLSMLGGSPEGDVTFGFFMKSPLTGELYYTFHNGAFNGGDQYFYHYNAGTTTWETIGGLVAGKLTNYGDRNPFVTGPQWDSSGVLWLNYQIDRTAGGNFGCGPPCEQFLVGFNGSSFVKFGGGAQTVPITTANLSSVYTVSASQLDTTCFNVLNDWSIDANGTFFLPWMGCDGGGIRQAVIAESSTGSFVTHQLTNYTIPWNPPNPALYLGNIQSPSSISLGTCTYFFYPDIFTQRGGEKAISSCDNFSTMRTFTLLTNFNPNWILLQDIPRQVGLGQASFLFENTNDSIRFGYINPDSPNLGKISIFTWSPGGKVQSGYSTR